MSFKLPEDIDPKTVNLARKNSDKFFVPPPRSEMPLLVTPRHLSELCGVSYELLLGLLQEKGIVARWGLTMSQAELAVLYFNELGYQPGEGVLHAAQWGTHGMTRYALRATGLADNATGTVDNVQEKAKIDDREDKLIKMVRDDADRDTGTISAKANEALASLAWMDPVIAKVAAQEIDAEHAHALNAVKTRQDRREKAIIAMLAKERAEDEPNKEEEQCERKRAAIHRKANDDLRRLNVKFNHQREAMTEAHMERRSEVNRIRDREIAALDNMVDKT